MENARDMSTPQPQIVLDWDGTVTERDTLDLVLEGFGDPEVYERAEAELEAGTMTLNEVIAAGVRDRDGTARGGRSPLAARARARPARLRRARARPAPARGRRRAASTS